MPMKREDGRLQNYLRHRPGCIFTRRLLSRHKLTSARSHGAVRPSSPTASSKS
jgi:hypothetical protein